MAEPTTVVFGFKELAEILVKREDIHQGLWGVYFKFGFGATNITDPQGVWMPSAIASVQEVGIQRFDAPNTLTVDAAEVNPLRPSLGQRKEKTLMKRRA